MWSDNETKTDLIGFKVHSDLVLSVVTDDTMLPVVMGVFGDWGGGKSSIMQMLQEDLQSPQHEDVVCLYFNGWTFEGYEDSKTALLSSILIQLGEHKTFGPALKEKVVGLLGRVKWMEVAKLGVKHLGVPLAVGAMTGGVGAVPALAASLVPGLTGGGGSKSEGKDSSEEEDTNWLDLVAANKGKPDLLEVRKFRQDFEKMLDGTSIKSLVILIDDLDRCLPERIIETLEAIKLFVAVPKTAFVIGADQRIVRHAIATRYVARQLKTEDATAQEQYDLTRDYLEKLIQVPYNLPRLSPSEIETYINLLACQKFLNGGACTNVLKHWGERRRENFYAAYGHGAISEALCGEEMPVELQQHLTWSNAIAVVVTEGLKGNPRQVKRMLNAMLLRKKLARVAGINIKDHELAKLMVLEYTHEKLFKTLNDWQASADGFPPKLKMLEESALAENNKKPKLDDTVKDWEDSSVQRWLRMSPPLGDVDLRDYFWLMRDRTSATLAGTTMVSTLVRRLFDDLVSDNEAGQDAAALSAAELDANERESLLHLLQQQTERHPDQESGSTALYTLAQSKFPGAAETLIKALRASAADKVTPSVPSKLEALAHADKNLAPAILDLFKHLGCNKETSIGIAVEQSAANLQKRRGARN